MNVPTNVTTTAKAVTGHTGVKLAVGGFILLLIIGIIVGITVYLYRDKTIDPSPSPSPSPPEVYGLGCGVGYADGATTQAAAQQYCANFGGNLATTEELTNASNDGAFWCTGGWVSDSTSDVYYPGSSAAGCGTDGINGLGNNPPFGCANCYGTKPSEESTYDNWSVLPWNQTTNQWSQFS